MRLYEIRTSASANTSALWIPLLLLFALTLATAIG